MSEAAQLSMVWSELGATERTVLVRIALRLKMGQDAYGQFGDKDRGRDFYREIQEEAMDASVYVAALMELARVS